MESTDENYLQQFQEHQTAIYEPEPFRNLEYLPNGDAFSYTVDSTLKIYSSGNGQIRNIISTKIDTMKYFQSNTLIHSKDKSLFHLSVFDNKYLRKFDSHDTPIHTISVNPVNDTFMSVGDDLVNLWDIRYKNAVFSMKSNERIGAMSRDNDYALVDNNFIYLFDWRNPKGPLSVKSIKPGFYRKIWYTSDNSCICVSSFTSHMFFDINGESIASLTFENECDGDTIDESNIYLCGSANMLFSYKIPDRRMTGKINMIGSECLAVRSNPKHAQFVCSSGGSLKMWNFCYETV